MPDENLAYKAEWIAKSFMVSFNEDVCAGITVTYDQPYGNLPVPAGRSGYVFSGWFTGLKNTTYTAIWTLQTYSVTLQTAGGALSPGSVITSYTTEDKLNKRIKTPLERHLKYTRHKQQKSIRRNTSFSHGLVKENIKGCGHIKA